MELYHKNGYANIPAILGQGMTFNFIIGGRGTGKTYGALKYVLDNHILFALMRRTQTQLDTIARPDTSPFKAVLRDRPENWTYDPVSIGKSVYGYFKTVTDPETNSAVHQDLIGYAISLSTVANLRGFDMSDIDLLIYDEFIPETHERPLKNESDAFFNCYETLNRNRELQGRKPIQVLCLANANDFACPILIGLNLVSTVEKMIRQEKTSYINPQKGVGIFLLSDSPISKRKQATALYKLTHGSAFEEMAISNAFAGTNDPDVYSVDLREYNPLVTVGEVTIYRHKSARLYYVSSHESGTVGRYSGDGIDMRRFLETHKNLLLAAMAGKMVYESHLIKSLFLRYCGFV